MTASVMEPSSVERVMVIEQAPWCFGHSVAIACAGSTSTEGRSGCS